jgi:hypothetical protein
VSPSRVQRLILSLFPRRFRDRYGEELGALVPVSTGGWRVTADLVRSAAREWLHPSFTGSPDERLRLRLESTTATVTVMWSVSTLAAAIFARSVDDHPVPGLRSWGWTAFVVGSGVFQVCSATVLVLGLAYWLGVVVRAWRNDDRSTLKFAFVPPVVGVLWLAVTGIVAIVGHHIVPGNYRHITSQGPTSAGGLTVLAIYGIFTIGCATVCCLCVVRALENSRLSATLLSRSTFASASVSAALVIVAVAASTCLARVVMVGGVGIRDAALAICSALALFLASAVAATSSMRGVRAALTRP